MLGATDWVDGYVARHFHQVSDLGKILDPIADRLLFFVGVGGIIVLGGAAPAWFCWLVHRPGDLRVRGRGHPGPARGGQRIDVTWFGKAGTFCLMFAFPLFLAGIERSVRGAGCSTPPAWLVGIPGLVLGYYAAVLYVPIGLRALREGRAARSASPERPVAPSG